MAVYYKNHIEQKNKCKRKFRFILLLNWQGQQQTLSCKGLKDDANN
jgi:hypothetical protein